MKRIAYGILTVFLILLCYLHIPVHAATILQSGTCGEALSWTLDSTGTLIISGSGAMYDYRVSGDNASPFAQNKNIKNVIIEPGATTIGTNAFWNCYNMESIVIPEGVTSLGDYAFDSCRNKKFTSVHLPSTVEVIGSQCFYWDDKLEDINLPVGLKKLGDWCFSGCCALNDITIPSTVESIDEWGLFYGCDTNYTGGFNYRIENITVDPDNPYYQSINGVVYTKDGLKLVCYPPGKKDTYYSVISGTEEIGIGAFSFSRKLVQVDVPGSVKRIDDVAFYNCSSLEKINLSEGLDFIDTQAFAKCSSLKKLVIPESVRYIVFESFINSTELTDVTIYGDPGGFELYRSGISERPDWYADTITIHLRRGTDIESRFSERTYEKPNIIIKYLDDENENDEDDNTNSQDVQINFDEFVAPKGCVYQFRLYNPNSGEHFYTGSQEETLNLVKAGWNFEGSGFITPTAGTPIYRLYSSEHGDHFYTTDESERDALLADNWTLDGDTGIAFPSATEETGRPMFRLYNPNAYPNGEAGAHHFTMSWEEVENLEAEGWQYEFIAWYSV